MTKAAGEEESVPTDIGIEEILRRIPHRPPFLLIALKLSAEPFRAALAANSGAGSSSLYFERSASPR